MRRKTGNSAKNKGRWRLTSARQDPCELENLQMILSLVDDADEEFMEDVMLKEAEPFEVKEATSVLQGLSSSCEECVNQVSLVRREQRGEKMLLKL